MMASVSFLAVKPKWGWLLLWAVALFSWQLVSSSQADPTTQPAMPAAEETGDEASAGWVKHPSNPVLGGDLGTCFDISVLKDEDRYRMWFSWRPRKSLALVESRDGIEWNEPVLILEPNPETDWEELINRPVVLRRDDGYHLWYTGMTREKSWIGYATSPDGVTWERQSDKPVLSPEEPWEQVAVMCPHVIWDEGKKKFRMWYSGGELFEPNAIGYATSPDGLNWTKHPDNPIFRPEPSNPWEQERVTACQVIRKDGWYLMFYIGFENIHLARIGVARSRDGITGWERHRANPIISPSEGQWDADAVYKPYAIFDGKQWMLWYNGRRGPVEQIGLATHKGRDLGF